jgi:phage major head subunit gpT-like protein
MAFTDDSGNLIGVTPNLLLVPPALENTARQLAGSVLDPESANNAINPQAGRWQVLTWHYLTDSNAWFMIDTNLMRMSLDWFDREPLSIRRKDQDEAVFVTYVASMRYSYGWSDWRWVAGSNPS